MGGGSRFRARARFPHEMSNLDAELAKAASGDDRDADPVVVPGTNPQKKQKGNVGLLIGLLVAMIGIAALVLSFRDAAVYAKSVSQIVAEKDKLGGRAVRVEGDLVNGTLVHQEQPCEYRFTIAEGKTQLPVRYANCVVPDTFRDVPGTKVTVEGKLSPQGQFEASLVMAKCPSKYEMKDRASKGEARPHDEMPGRN